MKNLGVCIFDRERVSRTVHGATRKLLLLGILYYDFTFRFYLIRELHEALEITHLVHSTKRIDKYFNIASHDKS